MAEICQLYAHVCICALIYNAYLGLYKIPFLQEHEDGGGSGARTHDLRLMSPPLYRLSYPAMSILLDLVPMRMHARLYSKRCWKSSPISGLYVLA